MASAINLKFQMNFLGRCVTDPSELRLLSQSVSGFLDGCFKRIPRKRRHGRPDHPAEARRDVAGERDRAALQIESVRARLKQPIGVHAPQKSLASAFGQGFLSPLSSEIFVERDWITHRPSPKGRYWIE